MEPEAPDSSRSLNWEWSKEALQFLETEGLDFKDLEQNCKNEDFIKSKLESTPMHSAELLLLENEKLLHDLHYLQQKRLDKLTKVSEQELGLGE